MNDASGFTASVGVDRGQIEQYFATMLSRAGGLHGFVSFRRFKLDQGTEVRISAVEWTGNLDPVVHRAEQIAIKAASETLDEFCCATAIPCALFRNGERARQVDITALLGVCIDCDDQPVETSRRVMETLGEPTLMTFSGGEWINPASGKPERKQHLLYVFKEPVTDPAEIGRVWVAYRELLRAIRADGVKGADRSATTVHPYRFCGGIWRKRDAPEARLVQIAKTTDRTITVDMFLEAVETLVAGGVPHKTDDAGPGAAEAGSQTDAATDADLIAAIVEGRELHDSLTRLAWRMVSRESNPDASRGLIVAELRKIMHRSARKKSDPDTWKARYDDLDRLVGDAITKQLKERATIPADPLTAKLAPQEPYPVDKLPVGFRQAAEAMARASEVDVSMTSSIALASATTSVALLRPGVLIDDRLIPLSVFIVVIAASSERKTTVDNQAFRGIRMVESKELDAEYRDELRHYNALASVHDKAKREILGQRKLGRDEKLALLKGLMEPDLPKLPRIMAADGTVEGIRDGLANGRRLFSLVTSEGAILLTGYSFGDKARRNAAAGMLSALGDGNDYPTSRAGREIMVRSPRFSMSLGVQPVIAQAFLGDRVLRGQGFVNRFLLCQPAERAGTRKLPKPDRRDLDAVTAFNRQTADRLREALRVEGGLFGPGPTDTPLVLHAEAEQAWRAFAVEMERQQAAGQPFEEVRGTAGKMAEMALRIAGVLALFEDPAATEISPELLEAGTAIARWHCNEFRRITRVEPADPLAERAEVVLRWLRNRFGRKGSTFNARDIYRPGVAGLGTRDPVDAVLNLLEHRGYIRGDGKPRGKVAGRPSSPRYQLVPGAA